MVDLVFAFTLFFSFLVVLLVILIGVKGLKNSSSENESEDDIRQHGSSGVSPGLRNRGRSNRNAGQQFSDEDDIGNVNYNDTDDISTKGKIGAKKMRKLEMKAEKKLARERELLEREERKKMMEEKERQQKLLEAKLEAEEKAKEEAERLEKERKEREEYEEYLKLKQSFAIEEEGYDGDANEEESQNKLQAFIEYIKEHKVVQMDELAGRFNLKTQNVVQRLQDLLQQELLIGVIDDRGKFIYITNEELQVVARFIKQRGRVSITDLAENSNTFINLNPAEVVK